MSFFKSKLFRAVVGVGLFFVPGLGPTAALIAKSIGANLILGAILERKPKAVRRLYEQSVMIRSAIQPQHVIYGRDKKSGVIVWYEVQGSRAEYLWYVIAIAEHEIDGFEKLHLDDRTIDIATEVDVDGYVTKSDFIDSDGKKLLRVGFHRGLANQVADPVLVATFNQWTVDHIGKDVAYFWARLELDKSEGGADPNNAKANVWYGGHPNNILATVRGQKVYDPRKDSTNGGTGAHRLNNPATWEWSDNPILCRADYLRSSRFGPAYFDDEISWPDVIAEADIADQTAVLPGAASQFRYRLNGVVTVDETPQAILESMQTADHGKTLFRPDAIALKVGAWEAPSQTIDASWLAGDYSARSSHDADDSYNAVRGTYSSAADNYTVVELVPQVSTAYQTEDGGYRNWRDILLPFTRDHYEAQRLAIIELKKSRQQTMAQIECNYRGELVKNYSTVTLALPDLAGTFRVEGKTSGTGGTTIIQLRQEAASDWTYDVPDLATPPVVPTVPRTPEIPVAPTGLVATSASEGIRLSWTLPNMSAASHTEVYAVSAAGGSYVEADYADTGYFEESVGNSRSSATLLTRTASESFIHALPRYTNAVPPVLNAHYYWVIARGYNGMVSAWHPVSATDGVFGTPGALGQGLPGDDGAASIDGFAAVDGPASWVRDQDGSTWNPAASTADVDWTFSIAGTAVARVSRRVTRAADGLLTVSTVAHPATDLNTARVTIGSTGGGTRAVTLSATYDHGGYVKTVVQGISAAVSGTDGTSGANAVNGVLTNEAHTVQSANNGTNYELNVAGGTFKMWSGTTDVTTSSVFAVLAPGLKNGLTMSVVAGTGVYSLSGGSWTSDAETFLLTGTYNGVTITRQYSIAKSKMGPIGANAPLLTVRASSQQFKYDGTGAANPSTQTITFDSVLQNIAGDVVWLATRYNAAGSSIGTVTLGGSGNTGRTLTNAQFGDAVYCVVSATLSGLSDVVTVVRTADGAQGADGADGQAGTAALNIGYRMHELSQWFANEALTTGPTSAVWSIQTVNGPVSTLGFRGVENNSTSRMLLSERITIVPGKNYQVSVWVRQPSGDRRNYLVVNFTDAEGLRIGAGGPTSDATGWTGKGTYHYWAISNATFASSWTLYTFRFGPDSPATIPTGAAAFNIGGLFLRDGAVGTETTVELQDYRVLESPNDGTAGINGYNTATLTAYKRAATSPGDNPGTLTYTFATAAWTPANGWSKTVPAGSDPVWAVSASALSQSATDEIAAGEWSGAVQVFADGVASVWLSGAGAPAGALGKVGDWYFNTTNSDVYEKTGASVWTLRKNLTGDTGNPGAVWHSGTGAPGTGLGIVGDWYFRTDTGQVYEKTGASVWTLRRDLTGPQGEGGVNGTRTAVLDMYRWSAAAPVAFPSGSSTYTWATGQFTAPATVNGWSLVPPAPVLGQTLWVVRQLYADTGTSTTSSVTWAATSSMPFAASGTDGTPGTHGQRVGILELYRWSAAAPGTYPSGNSTYTWATGAFTAPATLNSWSLTPGAAVTGQTLWGISVVVSNNETTATSVATWNSTTVYPVGYAGTNGTSGTNGFNTATLFAYKRAAVAPVDNPGTLTYTFATAGWTPANGWSKTIPVGTDPVWATVATAYANTPTDSIDAGEWATPVQAYANGSEGASGLNVATVFIYQRTTTDSAPTKPSVDSTYTFSTGGITGLNNGWTAVVPAFTGSNRFLWVTTATASSTTATDVITGAEWAAPQKLASDGTSGTNGDNGLNVATVYLFRRTTTSTPPALPNVDITYTFATGAATGLSNSWTQTLPTTGGAFRWVTIATASAVGATDTITPGEWAAVAILAEDGAPGLTHSISLADFGVSCDSAGNPKSGAFDAGVGQWQVIAGTTDVTASTTFAITGTSNVSAQINNTTNENFTGAKGAYRVTGITADTGHVDMTAAYSGSTVQRRFTVRKVKDGSTTISAQSTTVTAPGASQTTYIVASGPISMAVGADGTVGTSFAGTYFGTGTSGSFRLVGKVQYREPGGSWVDFPSSEATGTLARWVNADAVWEPGDLVISQTMAGPATARVYEFQLLLRKDSTTGGQVNWGGASRVFRATWQP